MKNKVVVYYTNGTSYSIADIVEIKEYPTYIFIESDEIEHISKAVTKASIVTTVIDKSELLGYAKILGNKIETVKFSNKFTTLVVTS